MYAREIDNHELTFDFTEGLHQDNLLFVDRESQSIWSQLKGEAISGPLNGTPLRSLPSIQSTWEYWRSRHPDTLVLTVPGRKGVMYSYGTSAFGPQIEGAQFFGHDTLSLGLGIAREGDAVFLPWGRIRGAKAPIEIVVGGESLTVHVDKKGLVAWAEDSRGEMVNAVMAYKKGWFRFHPDSKTYRKK